MIRRREVSFTFITFSIPFDNDVARLASLWYSRAAYSPPIITPPGSPSSPDSANPSFDYAALYDPAVIVKKTFLLLLTFFLINGGRFLSFQTLQTSLFDVTSINNVY